jgi:hypothetical protein
VNSISDRERWPQELSWSLAACERELKRTGSPRDTVRRGPLYATQQPNQTFLPTRRLGTDPEHAFYGSGWPFASRFASGYSIVWHEIGRAMLAFVRIVAAAVWIAALTNFGCHPASRPLRGSLEFRDSNWAKGELSGHVVYRAVASDREGSLRLYWGRDKLKRLSDVPIATWSHAAVPSYYYFLDRPRPSGATHLLLFAIDEDGDELTPPLALEITDTVRSTLAFRPLEVRCGPPTDDGEPLLLRSVDDMELDRACSEQLLNLVDFSRQTVIHFAVDIACPGDFGSRVQGLKYSLATDLLEIYVNIWSSNEYQANCHQDFWLAIDRLPTTTKVRLVKCEHPAMYTM